MKNILVTGAGALLGQGILRLLQISNFKKRIFTADPDPRSAGHWLGDYAITIPLAKDPNFMNEIKDIIARHKIDAILVGTDLELPIFSRFKNQLLREYNCIVIVSNQKVIDIANDKYLTAKFLEKNNFSFPYSVMANKKENLVKISEDIGFPLFAKPIYGARSQGVKKINNFKELMKMYSPQSKTVVQQYLPLNDGEYTSGCTVINGECKAIVTLKRDLRDGNTYRAYRDSETSIYDDKIKVIAEKLNSDGPVNFQFRVLNGEPIIFEINGRFSGTTPLRHFYGFNEVEAILNYYLFEIKIEKPKLKNGVVLKVWSDLFIDESELKALEADRKLKKPKAKFKNFSLKIV